MPHHAISAATQQAAIELANRRSQGLQGGLLAESLRPRDFEAAFAIQQHVAQLFNDQGNPIAAWKCLLPTTAKVVVAPIYQHDIHLSEISDIAAPNAALNSTANITAFCPIYASAAGLARVEPELAFELLTDLPPREQAYSEAEIDAALANPRLALELIQSRYHTPSEATHFDALADGLVNQGLWLGPRVDNKTDLPLDAFTLSVTSNAGVSIQKAAVHPNGAAKAGLYWLANFLCQRGIGLTQGQLVITGSYAGVLDLPLNQKCQFNYGDLGSFELSFKPKG